MDGWMDGWMEGRKKGRKKLKLKSLFLIFLIYLGETQKAVTNSLSNEQK